MSRQPLGRTTVAYTPVEFESVDILCGCELSDGSGLLMWTDVDAEADNQYSIRWATTSSPSDWLTNGYVTSASTAYTSGASINMNFGLTCWLGSDNLPWFALCESGESNGRTKIYKGDHATAPTSWAYVAELALTTANTTNLIGMGAADGYGKRCMGVPIIDGDDWTLPGVAARHSSVRGTQSTPRIYRSTDAGATWSQVLSKNYTNSGGNHAFACCSGNIGVHPTTGYWYWFSSGAGDTDLWESTDAGATWASIEEVSNTRSRTIYTDVASGLFGYYGPTDHTAKFNDIAADLADTTDRWSHVATSNNRIFVHDSAGNAYLFGDGTVQYGPPTYALPTVGGVGFGVR